MRTLIVYFSKFGNTQRLAEVMAETPRQAGDARVISIDQLAPSDFEGVGLAVMGSPTHAFSLPQAVRTVLKTLPPRILAGKSVAAFDTTVKPWPLRHLRASPKLLRHLVRLGGKPVAQRNTEPGSGLGQYRYVVEAAFAWLFHQRRVRVRYEKRDDIHQAFLIIGCLLICGRRILRSC